MDKRIIILKVALSFNKELYQQGEITYQLYRVTEDKILKELGDYY